LAIVTLVGCNDDESSPPQILKQVEKVGSDTKQLVPLAMRVQGLCVDASVQVGRAIQRRRQQQSSLQTLGSATPEGGLAAAAGQAIHPLRPHPPERTLPYPLPTEPADPAEMIPGIGGACREALSEYVLLAKSMHADGPPRVPFGPPTLGPNLWATNPWYRQQTMLALGAALRNAGGNMLSGAAFADFAFRNPQVVNAMMAPFGVSAADVFARAPGLPGPGAPVAFAPSAMAMSPGAPAMPMSFGAPATPGLGAPSLGIPASAPLPVPSNGFPGLSERVTFDGSAYRGAAKPEGVSGAETMRAYAKQYGDGWFQRRRLDKGN
jgi:hypothetical protein